MTETPLPPWPPRAALFLDLDGTLVDIVEHPSRTAASPRLRALLPVLPLATDGAVALISGRRIEELDRILAPHAYLAAGVHGLQRRDAAGRLSASCDVETTLPAVRELLEAFVRRHEGVWVEDKTMALAVHYRTRPELGPEVHRFVAELQRELPADMEILLGNAVFEIKPCVTDKGGAIAAFMEEAPFAGRTPVFVGDDVTDEAGFRTVNELGGVSVKVGSAPTIAQWRLADVEAVLAWLERAVETSAR